MWKQESNPTTSLTVEGYEPVKVTCTDADWAGLALENKGASAVIDGSQSSNSGRYAVMAVQEKWGGIAACKHRCLCDPRGLVGCTNFAKADKPILQNF